MIDGINNMINTFKEQWKVIKYRSIKANTYEISNWGRIRNIQTRKILKPNMYKGYYKIKLKTRFKKYCSYKIHRLVATMFIEGHTKERNTVNHKDGIKTNNYDWNLEWVTISENIIHAWETGLIKLKNK